MTVKDLMLEAYCNTSDQSELCSIAHRLIQDEISKDEAAIEILNFVKGMGERLPCLISELNQVSQ